MPQFPKMNLPLHSQPEPVPCRRIRHQPAHPEGYTGLGRPQTMLCRLCIALPIHGTYSTERDGVLIIRGRFMRNPISVGSTANRLNVMTTLLTDRRFVRLTSRQHAVLLACYSLPHASVRAMALFLKAPRAAVSHSLKMLAERGLVERSTDPTDRRGTVASCTPIGEKLVRSVYRTHLVNKNRAPES